MSVFTLGEASAQELDLYTSLAKPHLRRDFEQREGIFVAESLPVLEAALAAGCQLLSLLMEPKYVEREAAGLLAQYPEVPVYTGTAEELEQLTGYKMYRSILGAFRRPPEQELETVLAGAQRVAVLVGLVDATNVGAIFRSAAALGVDAILLDPTCSEPWLRRALRVSMGTVFQIPWARWSGSLIELTERGFATVALALEERAISIRELPHTAESKLALLFGCEGYGLPAELIQQCSYVAKIPMSHQVDSLNVAAASAVVFWELCPERK